MPAAFGVSVEITFQIIWEKEKPENGKHDKKLKQNDHPHLFPPSGHVAKTIHIKMEYFGKDVFTGSHSVLILKLVIEGQDPSFGEIEKFRLFGNGDSFGQITGSFSGSFETTRAGLKRNSHFGQLF